MTAAKRAVPASKRASKRTKADDVHTVPWWPPRVGDLLQHATTHGAGDCRIKRVEAPIRVLSVFDHDGATRIVTAEWFPTKRRWNYAVWDAGAALYGILWPDGKPRPENPR